MDGIQVATWCKIEEKTKDVTIFRMGKSWSWKPPLQPTTLPPIPPKNTFTQPNLGSTHLTAGWTLIHEPSHGSTRTGFPFVEWRHSFNPCIMRERICGYRLHKSSQQILQKLSTSSCAPCGRSLARIFAGPLELQLRWVVFEMYQKTSVSKGMDFIVKERQNGVWPFFFALVWMSWAFQIPVSCLHASCFQFSPFWLIPNFTPASPTRWSWMMPSWRKAFMEVNIWSRIMMIQQGSVYIISVYQKLTENHNDNGWWHNKTRNKCISPNIHKNILSFVSFLYSTIPWLKHLMYASLQMSWSGSRESLLNNKNDHSAHQKWPRLLDVASCEISCI